MIFILFVLFLHIHDELPSQYKGRLLQSQNKGKIIIGFLMFKTGFCSKRIVLKAGIMELEFSKLLCAHLRYQGYFWWNTLCSFM